MKIRIHTTHSFPDPASAPNPAARRARAAARLRRVSAYTLIETIVATFLAAILISAFYGSLGAGFSMMQLTRENLRATQVITQRMEAIRLASYTSLQNTTLYPTNFTEYYNPGSTTNGTPGVAYNVSYNWATGLGSLPPGYRSNIMLVTVKAAWTSGNLQHTRSMQTYVARRGIQSYVAGN